MNPQKQNKLSYKRRRIGIYHKIFPNFSCFRLKLEQRAKRKEKLYLLQDIPSDFLEWCYTSHYTTVHTLNVLEEYKAKIQTIAEESSKENSRQKKA